MPLNLKHETIIKLVVVLYFIDRYAKAYWSISVAPVLDVCLMLILLHVMKRGMLRSDLKILSLVFISGLLLVTKLSHGITLNTFSLLLTSRAPFMIFITILLAMYYLRLQPDLDVITRFIENVIAVLVVFIVLDGVYINYVGSVHDLIGVFGKAGYVYLVNSPFFELIAQGLVTGAQHASIISCAGIILFFPYGKIKFNRIILFVLSIIGLSFSVTNTALMSFLIAIIVVYFMTFRINISTVVFSVGLLVIIIFVMGFFSDWATIKYDVLDGASEQGIVVFMEKYIEIYMSPMDNLKSLSWPVLLTGIGHSSFESIYNLLRNEYSLVFYHADFGFLIMILEHGIINVLMYASIYLGFLLYVKKNIRHVFDKKQREYLVKMTAVVSLFIASASHYTTPTKGGLMQVIILLSAITVITIQRNIYRMRQPYNSEYKDQVVA